MGFLDFLKKNELNKIQQLSDENKTLIITIQSKDAEIRDLNSQIINLKKYEGITDIDKLISEKKAEFEIKKQKFESDLQAINEGVENTKREYNKAYELYLKLQKQNSIYEESIEMADYGIYSPHFNFEDSERYKSAISNLREFQKEAIKNGSAVIGGENILWNNSVSQGEAMVKRQKKLMLRAFNGECDSFISTVEWNNISKFEERLQKSYEAINKVYEVQGIHISSKYRDLKLRELWMVFEYKKKKYEEKEEQRQIREQMREEEKAAREIETARLKAEKEEETFQKALDKAREELNKASGDKQEKLYQQIADLEVRLKEAEMNKERALSMAQQTKRGHVYVISNIGSFGENVYKIGMTRRLEPLDRVKELGDASVPFSFDVHAMIFSEDAPALEAKLHRIFENERLNMINPRKEFFNVSLEEIEKIVIENHGQIEFTKIAEAQEYRESKILKQQGKIPQIQPTIFHNAMPAEVLN